MGAVVLPAAIGLGVGIRLMYVGSERKGLRAGGTSRVVLLEDDVYSAHSIRQIQKGEEKDQAE